MWFWLWSGTGSDLILEPCGGGLNPALVSSGLFGADQNRIKFGFSANRPIGTCLNPSQNGSA